MVITNNRFNTFRPESYSFTPKTNTLNTKFPTYCFKSNPWKSAVARCLTIRSPGCTCQWSIIISVSTACWMIHLRMVWQNSEEITVLITSRTENPCIYRNLNAGNSNLQYSEEPNIYSAVICILFYCCYKTRRFNLLT